MVISAGQLDRSKLSKQPVHLNEGPVHSEHPGSVQQSKRKEAASARIGFHGDVRVEADPFVVVLAHERLHEKREADVRPMS